MKQKVMFPMLTIEVHLNGQEKKKTFWWTFRSCRAKRAPFCTRHISTEAFQSHLGSIGIKHFKKSRGVHIYCPNFFIPYWSRKFRGNDVNGSQKLDWSTPWRCGWDILSWIKAFPPLCEKEMFWTKGIQSSRSLYCYLWRWSLVCFPKCWISFETFPHFDGNKLFWWVKFFSVKVDKNQLHSSLSQEKLLHSV